MGERNTAFIVDSAACSGCKACQVACKDKNDLPVGMLWRRVYEIAGGGWRKKAKPGFPTSSPTISPSPASTARSRSASTAARPAPWRSGRGRHRDRSIRSGAWAAAIANGPAPTARRNSTRPPGS